ncbi:MAG: methyl-accepting chemotaxis protein [Pseudomonadales bacterium]|nr:methyl-accepting chemotaxis protein [Pseudomonadales bacterium]
MSAFKTLPFKVKFVMPIALLALLFIATGVVGLLVNQSLAEKAVQVGQGHLQEINYLLQADRDLYQAQVAERSIALLAPDNGQIATLKAQYRENIDQARERMGRFFNTVPEPALQAYREGFNRAYESWVALTRPALNNPGSARDDSPQAREQIAASEERFQTMRGIINELEEKHVALSDVITTSIQQEASDSRATIITMLGVGLIFSAACILLIPPMVVNPLRLLSQRMRDIASGKGDLTARLDIQQRDEIGVIVTAFNQLMDKMQALVAQTKAIAEDVADQTEAAAEDAKANREANEYQHEALTLVATAVNEMASAIHEVARNTSDVAEEAKSASGQSEQGQKVVYETIRQIQALSKQVQSAAELIAHVEQEADNVNSVIDVIGGVAEQTNLLALNAAIEAARAGEQGRGFAVVADEVRTLASRTQESTQDIQRMLQNLQQGVKDAVAAMNSSRESARTTVTTTEGAGAALDDIKEAVTNISKMTIQIAAAAEEQSEVTEDINRNLTQIQTYSDTSSEMAEKNLVTSRGLNQAAQQLRKSVRNFKTA